MLNNVLKTVLAISVSGSLIALVLLLLKPFVQNKFSKKWCYYIWLIVIARLIVPFGLPLNIPMLIPDVERTATSQPVLLTDTPLAPVSEPDTVKTEYINIIIQPDSSVAEMTNPETTIEKATAINLKELSSLVVLVWLLTGILLFMKKLINYYRFIRLIKATSVPIDNDTLLDIAYSACVSLGIKKELPILSNRSIRSPMLIGLLKPIIVLPDTQTRDLLHLKYTFMHELTHFKRCDIFYKWLVQLTLCVHWFNPLVYLIRGEINKACELSCDEAVIKRLTVNEQRTYGDALLRSFEMTSIYINPVVSMTLTENSKLMKKRLGAIMNFHKKSKLSVFTSVLLIFILCTGAMFTSVQAKSKDLSMQSNDIVLIDNKSLSKQIDTIRITGTNCVINIEKSNDGSFEYEYDKTILNVSSSINKNIIEIFVAAKTETPTDTHEMSIRISDIIFHKIEIISNSMVTSLPTMDSDINVVVNNGGFVGCNVSETYDKNISYVINNGVGKIGFDDLAMDYNLNIAKSGISSVSLPAEFTEYTDDSDAYKYVRGNGKAKINVTLNSGMFMASIYSVSSQASYSIPSSGSKNQIIPIDITELKPNETRVYGPFDLKTGDIVSSDITWSNDAGLYFSIGKEFLDFRGFFSSYSKFGEYMERDIVVNEDGLYYIFIGNPSTDEPEVKDVSGIIKIYRNTKNTISVDIPKPTGKTYVKNYGGYALNKDDDITADLDWKGEGHVMFLYTKEKFDSEDVSRLVTNGVLPLGYSSRTFSNGYDNNPSISSNLTYVSDNKEQKLNFTTTLNKPIYWSNKVPETATYYIYVIAMGDTGITDLKGEIILPNSTVIPAELRQYPGALQR